MAPRCRSEMCTAEGIAFVDTMGGWHPTALETITRLGRQLARNVGRDDQEVVRHFNQRLAVLMVRDNVAMICARTSSYPPPKTDRDADS